MIPVDELLSGRYRIDRLLGQGGMADVFRAIDLTDSSAVAVKVVRSADPGLAQRLATEARALARLTHPGLVRLLDAGVHDGQAYLVMELVEGPTLAARLRRGPLSPSRTAVLGQTLAGALAFVHEQGIVHRDVKPANVLLGPGPRARLADFGIARLADASSLTVTGTTLGTAAYMAPEQIEHHAVGTSADVWSLGMILLECLTGERVFEGTATEVVARRLAGPVPLPRDLPATWRLLFEGMLAPEPARRPTASHVEGLLSAGPFAEPWDRRGEETVVVPGLSAATTADHSPNTPDAFPTVAVGAVPGADGRGGGTLIAPQRAAPPTAPSPSRRRSPWLWAVAAVAILLAAGLTAWALSAKSPHKTAPPHVTTTTTVSTTTSTTSPTTTTTSPTAGSAAAALLTDVQTGENNGSVTAGAARSLRDDLNQALSASSAGNQGQTAQAVDAMIGTINDEVQKGTMTEAESSTLFSDVAALANVLGVSTTAPTTTSPGGGNTGNTGNTGNGPGHGH